MYKPQFKKGDTILVEYDQMAVETKTISAIIPKDPNIKDWDWCYMFENCDNVSFCEEIDKISALNSTLTTVSK